MFIMHSKLGLFGMLSFVLGLAAGCATISKPAFKPVPQAPHALKACFKWSRSLHAHLSEISIANNARRILVSSSDEHGHFHDRIRMYSRWGRLLWSHGLHDPVKAQALSENGGIAAVSSYDGKLRVFSGRGKLLWSRNHLGTPVILPKARRIILLNDDDSQPRIAFFSYTYGGKLIGAIRPMKSLRKAEPLEMFVSPRENAIAVLMSDDLVVLYDVNGHELWRDKLIDKAVALAPQGPPNPVLYALSLDHKNPHKQVLLRVAHSKKTIRKSLGYFRYQTLLLSKGHLFLYGNAHTGQAVASYQAKTLKREWSWAYPLTANYSSEVFAASIPQPYMTAAIDKGDVAGQLHILGISGGALWDAKVNAANGIYSYGLAEDVPALAVGAGESRNGVLQFFTIRHSCRRR